MSETPEKSCLKSGLVWISDIHCNALSKIGMQSCTFCLRDDLTPKICNISGYNLIHTASEKHVGVQRYSNRVGITQVTLIFLHSCNQKS